MEAAALQEAADITHAVGRIEQAMGKHDTLRRLAIITGKAVAWQQQLERQQLFELRGTGLADARSPQAMPRVLNVIAEAGAGVVKGRRFDILVTLAEQLATRQQQPGKQQ